MKHKVAHCISQKIALFLLLALAFLTIQSAQVSAPQDNNLGLLGCCVERTISGGTQYCQSILDTACPDPETFYLNACNAISTPPYNDNSCDVGCCVLAVGGNNVCDYNQAGGTFTGPSQGGGVYREYCRDLGGQFSAGLIGPNCLALCSGGSQSGALTGTVRDAAGSPISAATVSIPARSLQTTTNPQGQYSFSTLEPGSVLVQASKTGYLTSTATILIESSITKTLNFALTLQPPAPSVWTARIYVHRLSDGVDLSSLNSVTVRWSTFTNPNPAGSTKTYGTVLPATRPVEFTNLPTPETIYFEVSAPGYQTRVYTNISPSAGTIRVLNISIPQGSSTCGNGVLEQNEQCDATAGAQPNQQCALNVCTASCTCPSTCAELAGAPASQQSQYCAYYPLQCTNNQGTVQSGPYGCPAQSSPSATTTQGICCNVPVIPVPTCIDGLSSGLSIGSTTDTSIGYCRCGGNYLSLTTHANKYCCNGNVLDGACQTGTIRGIVRETGTNTPINGATIALRRMDGTTAGTTTTTFLTRPGWGGDGAYELTNVAVGSYSLHVTHANNQYIPETITPIQISVSPITYQDVLLTRLGSEVCDPLNTWFPNPDTVAATVNVQGEPDVKLTWHMQCVDEVAQFEILEQTGTGPFQLKETITAVAGQENYQRIYDYPSVDAVCDQTIIYKIRAIPKPPRQPSQATSANSNTYSPGNCVCMGITSSQTEFCTCETATGQPSTTHTTPPCTTTLSVHCDANNQLAIIEDCTPSAGTSGVCVLDGSGSPQQTTCINPEPCQDLGIPGTAQWNAFNIFGLFYDKTYTASSATYTCLTKTIAGQQPQQRYCYQDYSKTTVDACYSCNPQGSCYDYKSAGACDRGAFPATGDHCSYETSMMPGEQHACRWYGNAPFEEFGKGLCYAEDYQGTDKCGMCGPSAGLFYNTGCTDEICDLLGSCYASSDQSSCIACNTQSNCYTYQTLHSCQGTTPFSINAPWGNGAAFAHVQTGHENDFIFSGDACARNRCKWIGPAIGGSCIKDGNDDGRNDCQSQQVPACYNDNTPPLSAIDFAALPPGTYLNAQGPQVQFVFPTGDNAQEAKVYWCLVKSSDVSPNNCIPIHETIVSGTTARVADVIAVYTNELGLGPGGTGVEGNYIIRHYALDKHNNSGLLREDTIYIDTKKPVITLGNPTIVLNPSSNKADISMPLYESSNPSQPIYCTDRLRMGTLIDVSLLSINQQLITSPTNPYTLNYNAMPDGSYSFELTCKDNHNNQLPTIQQFFEVRVHNEINGFQPTGTINSQSFMLSMNTQSNYPRCEYSVNNGPYQQYFSCGGQCPTPIAGGYRWQQQLNNPDVGTSNGYHTISIQCGDIGAPSDFAYYSFGNDQSTPQTKLYEVIGGTSVAVNEGVTLDRESFFFKFTCTDPALPNLASGSPQGTVSAQFGCKNTKWCSTTDLSSVCTPTTNATVGANAQVFSLANPGEQTSKKLCWRSIDSGTPANTEQTSCIIVSLDTTPATFDIEFIPGGAQSSPIAPGPTITSNQNYIVHVNASKKIYIGGYGTGYSQSAQYFDISFATPAQGQLIRGTHYDITFLGIANCDTMGACEDWWYELSLYDHPIYNNREGPSGASLFHIVAETPAGIDSTDAQITEGQSFTIDTVGPAAPILVYPNELRTPPREGLVTSIDNYPIYGIANVNGSVIWFTSLQGGYTQTTPTQPGSAPLASGTIPSGTIGATTLTITTTNPSLYTPGRFIEFTNPAKLRATHERYQIMTATPGSGNVMVTISPGLETAVSNDPIALYSTFAPGGWFSINPYFLPPPKLLQGMNNFTVWSQDALGNIGGNVKFGLLYSTQQPDIALRYPAPGSALVTTPETIGALVNTHSSLAVFNIDTASVHLSINNVNYSCGAGLQCTPQIIAGMNHWNLTTSVSSFTGETQSVKLSLRTNSGYFLYDEWQFLYNADYPQLATSTPIFISSPPSVFRPQNSRWYVPITVGVVELSFNPAQDVEIVSAAMRNATHDNMVSTCSPVGMQTYHCGFSPLLHRDGNYNFTARVRVIRPDGSPGPIADISQKFVLDRTPPIVTLTVDNPIQNDEIFAMLASITDPSIFQEQTALFYGDLDTPVTAPLSPTPTGYSATANVNIHTLPDNIGPYTVAVRVTDIVGHEAIASLPVFVVTTAIPHCSDGIDNDADSLIDFCTDPINGLNILGGPCDPGCQSETSNDETYCTLHDCTNPGPYCGNGQIDSGETCDPGDSSHPPDWGLVYGCSSLGFSGGGSLNCIGAGQPNACHFNTSGCVQQTTCGNSVIEPGEQCDDPNGTPHPCTGLDPNGQYTGGTWTCTQACTISVLGCTANSVCNNGVIEPGEECDPGAPEPFGNLECQNYGFTGGSLTCTCPGIIGLDNCFYVPPDACGDGTIGANESCDFSTGGSPIFPTGPTAINSCSDFGMSGTLSCFPAAAPNGCSVDSSTCTCTTINNNGIIEPGETCDAAGGSSTFHGLNCGSYGMGFNGGLTCTNGATSTAGCFATPTSGNSIIEPGEHCDGPSLPSSMSTCGAFIMNGGSAPLSCSSTGYFSLSACTITTPILGNGVIDPGESCDTSGSGGQPVFFNNMDCSSFGFNPGPLICSFGAISTIGCTMTPECGNGRIDPGEQCDKGSGTLPAVMPAGADQCSEYGLSGSATLSCSAQCTISTSACGCSSPTCGNSIIEPGESCEFDSSDNPIYFGHTCSDFGPYEPTAQYLDCDDSTCTVIIDMCPLEHTCGNGIIEIGEICEPGVGFRDPLTCMDIGFNGGILGCTGWCQIDTNNCFGGAQYICGNNVAELGEQCDGTDLRSITCSQLGFTGGILQCTGACMFNTHACTGNPGSGGECIPGTTAPVCTLFGFLGGNATCNAQGHWDTSTCDAIHPQCSDGIDNDGDLAIDYPADPDCLNPYDNLEVIVFPPSLWSSTHPNPAQIYTSGIVTYHWNVFSPFGIKGYSVIGKPTSSVQPHMSEQSTSSGTWTNETNITWVYAPPQSFYDARTYPFRVRPKDIAGNWWPTYLEFNTTIDNVGPGGYISIGDR